MRMFLVFTIARHVYPASIPCFFPFYFNFIQALPCRTHTIPSLHNAVNDSIRPRHFLSSWFAVRYLSPSSIQ
ncbi:hypothetical protein EV702DRAFT_1094949 [Suillus placidus]|uniref:Uncharacterized protein n=1 Tax=Suillus placidus TaxID=48579 RepID=A0A9P6ZYM7_9AGAM|nr:hypothetical protein EV702DRAFT_1094949 [Suillus placidus]